MCSRTAEAAAHLVLADAPPERLHDIELDDALAGQNVIMYHIIV